MLISLIIPLIHPRTYLPTYTGQERGANEEARATGAEKWTYRHGCHHWFDCPDPVHWPGALLRRRKGRGGGGGGERGREFRCSLFWFFACRQPYPYLFFIHSSSTTQREGGRKRRKRRSSSIHLDLFHCVFHLCSSTFLKREREEEEEEEEPIRAHHPPTPTKERKKEGKQQKGKTNRAGGWVTATYRASSPLFLSLLPPSPPPFQPKRHHSSHGPSFLRLPPPSSSSSSSSYSSSLLDLGQLRAHLINSRLVCVLGTRVLEDSGTSHEEISTGLGDLLNISDTHAVMGRVGGWVGWIEEKETVGTSYCKLGVGEWRKKRRLQ